MAMACEICTQTHKSEFFDSIASRGLSAIAELLVNSLRHLQDKSAVRIQLHLHAPVITVRSHVYD